MHRPRMCPRAWWARNMRWQLDLAGKLNCKHILEGLEGHTNHFAIPVSSVHSYVFEKEKPINLGSYLVAL